MLFTQKSFEVHTPGREIIEITPQIREIAESGATKQGLCHVFLAHTSASLIFCENYDATVRLDLETFMKRLVPDGDPMFLHNAEGADDMPAHVRSILTQNSLTIPILQGKLALGTWQGVFLWEHRKAPHARKVVITVMGNDLG